MVLTRKNGFVKRRNNFREWKGNLKIFMMVTKNKKKKLAFRIPGAHWEKGGRHLEFPLIHL